MELYRYRNIKSALRELKDRTFYFILFYFILFYFISTMYIYQRKS